MEERSNHEHLPGIIGMGSDNCETLGVIPLAVPHLGAKDHEAITPEKYCAKVGKGPSDPN